MPTYIALLGASADRRKSKLNNNFLEKKLIVAATTRNWKTINALLEMSI